MLKDRYRAKGILLGLLLYKDVRNHGALPDRCLQFAFSVPALIPKSGHLSVLWGLCARFGQAAIPDLVKLSE